MPLLNRAHFAEKPTSNRARTLLAGSLAILLSGLITAQALPIAATAATVQNGITLSVDEGQALAGAVMLSASDQQSADPVSISIDGTEQASDTTLPGVSLIFQAHGWEATTKNTFVINGSTEIAPMTRYYDWANGSWTFPSSALKAGVNTVELRIGSATMVLDPATNANDDFNIRNVKLSFADGTLITDPAVANNKTVPMGDGASTSLRTYTWSFTVPLARLIPTSAFSWDTDAAEPGEHEISATSADGTRTSAATVTIGNPEATPERVILTPPQDASTSQSFTWRTGSAVTDGAVHIRPAGSDAEWTVVAARANAVLTSGGVATRTHSVTVRDLQPGTAYEYFVGTDAAPSATYTFTTAGVAGEPFTFLYFGDAQNDLTEKWAPVVEQAYEKYPDAVGSVNAGDLIDASRNDSEWTEWFDAMDGYSQSGNVIAAPGNHEYVGDSFLRNWKAAFEYDLNGPKWDGETGTTEGERQEAAYRAQIAIALEETAYYTDYQGVRFITLNAGRTEAAQLMTPENLPSCSVDCPDPSQLWLDMQAEWLDEVLANNPNKWAVAVFHQPVFSTATGRDEADIRATWLPVFQRNDIDLVLMGHDHTYARGFVNKDATSTSGVTTGPVYAVSVSGPKYYEQQPAGNNVWTHNGATQVVSAGHTSTFQGITVTDNQIHYESIVAAKWDDQSTTDVPVGGTLDSFTITKYDSGAKFVTEDGVAIPEDPGTDPGEPEDSGLAFSIPNGATVSGITPVRVTDEMSTDEVSISVDGVIQPTTPLSAQVTIAFEAHGYAASSKNTIVINDDWTILPATAYNSYATGRFTVPAGALKPGANKIQFFTGSNEMMNDPATDGRNDDFNVRNLRLEFSDGTRATDPTMSSTAIANLGDNGNNVRSWQWDITVPEDKLVSGSEYLWDTTAVSSGRHNLEATSGDGLRSSSIVVTVDNYEPVTLDLTDGDVIRSLHEITTTTDVEPIITVDGTSLPVEERRRVVDPVFVFEGDGFQPDAAMDSIWINGELFRVLGVPEAAHGYKEVRVEIPWDNLTAGTNVIRIRAGSGLDPEATTGVDNFTTRNARLEFAGGRVARDPAHTTSQTFSYNNNARWRDFTITIPDRFENVYQADWDTSTVEDGQHTVTVARPDDRSSTSVTVTTDNSGPQIDVQAPVDNKVYGKGSFVVDARAEDVHDVASFTMTIDGEEVENGQTFTSDDLPGGDHVFVATARDSVGNTSESRAEFSTTGNYPLKPLSPRPHDGSTENSTTTTTLSALVQDPTGDELDVEFKWGYRGDFAQGWSTARQGTSTSVTPGDNGSPLADSDYLALGTDDGREVKTAGVGAYPFQQFEIEVPTDLDAETFTVEWSGSVPETQRAALSVWNHTTSAWQLVAEGQGADLDLAGEASVADSVRDGKARVMVQDIAATVIAEGEENAVWAWVSDTQFYSERDESTYAKQMEWVLDNKDAEGLGYAIHTGDIVNQRSLTQWDVADRMQKIWDDAGFPYGLVPGNHDIDGDGTYATYQQFFGESRYAGKPWYGGGFDDNVQHYDIVSTPAADYLVVFVDWYLDQADIDWANEVIGDHPDYNVIIATHQYLDNNGAYINPAPRIFEQIVKPNENVDAVLSGHIGVALNVKQVGDRSVIEVMADYQSAPNNGDGWMRTVTFDAAAQTFSNRTFSVTRSGNHWVDESKENFTLPMSIEAPERFVSTDYVAISALSDTVIESIENVESDTRASAPAGALERDTRYSWYVEATDGDGFSTVSDLWDFSTQASEVPNPDVTKPVLSVPTDSTILVGAAFDPMAGVTATDDRDGDLTAAITVSGSVDPATPGRYTLRYSVADTAGNSTAATRIVDVVLGADITAPMLSAPSSTIITVDQPFDALSGVTAMDDRDGDLSAAVQVSGEVDTSTAGTYLLTYRVVDAAGNTTSASRTVVVVLAEPDHTLTPESKTLEISSVDQANGTITVEVPTEFAGEPLTWVVYSSPVILGTFSSAPDGSLVLKLPSTLLPGAHRLAGYSGNGSIATWASFTVAGPVTPPSATDPLAGTGVSVVPSLVTAVILLLLGGGLLIAVRRRARTIG
jgi:predicted MPP superfamily phosphohydrolase